MYELANFYQTLSVVCHHDNPKIEPKLGENHLFPFWWAPDGHRLTTRGTYFCTTFRVLEPNKTMSLRRFLKLLLLEPCMPHVDSKSGKHMCSSPNLNMEMLNNPKIDAQAMTQKRVWSESPGGSDSSLTSREPSGFMGAADFGAKVLTEKRSMTNQVDFC